MKSKDRFKRACLRQQEALVFAVEFGQCDLHQQQLVCCGGEPAREGDGDAEVAPSFPWLSFQATNQ